MSVEYIDVERRPALRRRSTACSSSGRWCSTTTAASSGSPSDGEQELTNGLIKVVQGKQNKVYFVQGHGETGRPKARIATATATIAASLKSDNFAHDELVLAQQKEVPADATVLIVAGPTTDLFPAEIDMLKAYLARGGKVLFLLDPPSKAEAPDLTNVIALLKEWGIDAGTNIVVDASGMGQMLGTDPEVPLAAKYDPHPITDRFNLLTAYSMARSVTVDHGRREQSVCAEPGRDQPEQLGRDRHQGADDVRPGRARGRPRETSRARCRSAPPSRQPSRSLARAPATSRTTPKPPETRIVVIGDSDFASNGWLGIPGNRDLFMNAVNWLAQQENLISIRPKDPEDRRITLSADQDRRSSG